MTWHRRLINQEGVTVQEGVTHTLVRNRVTNHMAANGDET